MKSTTSSDTRNLKEAATRVACQDLFNRCSLIAVAMRCAEHGQPASLIIKDDKVEVQACCADFQNQVGTEITLKTGNKPIRIEEFQAAKHPPTASASA